MTSETGRARAAEVAAAWHEAAEQRAGREGIPWPRFLPAPDVDGDVL